MANRVLKPKISIVLGTYNRILMLKGCIDSIRENYISVPYETIVIDAQLDTVFSRVLALFDE